MTEKHEFRPALTEWKGYCYCGESGFSRPGLDGNKPAEVFIKWY